MEGEGQQGVTKIIGNDRPPGRPAELLYQQPDEELIERKAKQIDDEEARRADVMAIPLAMAAEAVFAVGDVADAVKTRKTSVSESIGSTCRNRSVTAQ